MFSPCHFIYFPLSSRLLTILLGGAGSNVHPIFLVPIPRVRDTKDGPEAPGKWKYTERSLALPSKETIMSNLTYSYVKSMTFFLVNHP